MSKLNAVERDILKKLPVKGLVYFQKIANDKEFETFIKLTNTLVDYEKNDVFKLDESDPTLPIKKAYARGRAGGYAQFGRLIMAAGEEIERREKERQDGKNKS